MLIKGIQLPVFFKLGYTKAKIFSILPFAVLMAGYMAFMAMQNISALLADFLGKLAGSDMIAPMLIALIFVIVFISYVLSIKFYEKREF